MTTLISLPTRDCIVIGCDSLATSSQTILDPHRLLAVFFDPEGNLRRDDSGQPMLNHAKRLLAYTEELPRNQLPSVTKIFSLAPLKAGLLFAGISGIGSNSVRSLVENFNETEMKTRSLTADSPLAAVAEALLEFLYSKFEECYPDVPKEYRPGMEILLSGYSGNSRVPEVFRLRVGPLKECTRELQQTPFDIVFGGQHDVIQRVVKGIDLQSFLNLRSKHESIVESYYTAVQDWLKIQGVQVAIPRPDFSQPSMQLFANDFGGVRGIFPDNGSLSEQAAINFVEFLITTMIHAQEFSDRIPTVGGDIHVAIIIPAGGFKWISREEYQFQGHSVPRYE
jgi:hypothetical protein